MTPTSGTTGASSDRRGPHADGAASRTDDAAPDDTGQHRLDLTAPTPMVPGWRPGSVIDLAGVEKVYRTGAFEVAALRGVTMTIDEGEFVAIMGPSGSGKSTLMHILGCLDSPTAGTYRLAGDDVSTMTEVELAEVRNARIGFVFQQFNLLASMDAWRNVELPLVYAGIDRAARRERSMEALARVGLSDRVDHRPGELSGGQQQRVAVARALVTDPALILADEPTGNLDSVAARGMLDLLTELHANGRTIVLITHDAEVALAAHRTIRIRDGNIQDGGGGGVSPGRDRRPAATPGGRP